MITHRQSRLEFGGRRDGVALSFKMRASTLPAELTQTHPFVDGDERTGFIISVLFLELYGAKFIAPEEAAAQAVLGLAKGAIDEAGYVAFLRDNVQS